MIITILTFFLYTLHVRPIISNDAHWPIENLNLQIEYAKQIYSDIGINLIFMEPIYINTCSNVFNDSDWEYIIEASRNHATQYREIPIWFVDRIILPGSMYEGISVGCNDYGIAISKRSSFDATAHELGHQLGLEHIWDEQYGINCPIDNCSTKECRYNVMGYCHEKTEDSDVQYIFKDEQIAQIYSVIEQYLSDLIN